MAISVEEVQSVAMLARLGLTEKEAEKFAAELSVILDYVKQLREIDTGAVEPTHQVTRLSNAVREDVLIETTEAKRRHIVEQAPIHDGAYIKTKRVK